MRRCEFVSDWCTQGEPRSFWLPGLFFPQGLLAAVLQRHARRHTGTAIDALRLRIQPTVYRDEEALQVLFERAKRSHGGARPADAHARTHNTPANGASAAASLVNSAPSCLALRRRQRRTGHPGRLCARFLYGGGAVGWGEVPSQRPARRGRCAQWWRRRLVGRVALQGHVSKLGSNKRAARARCGQQCLFTAASTSSTHDTTLMLTSDPSIYLAVFKRVFWLWTPQVRTFSQWRTSSGEVCAGE